MQFVKTEKGHGKLTRAFAVLLSLLIIVSMMYVGKVGTIEASAANAIFEGKTFTIDASTHKWWYSEADTSVIWWNSDGTKYYASKAVKVDDVNKLLTFTFPMDVSTGKFILGRTNSTDIPYCNASGSKYIEKNSWDQIKLYYFNPGGSDANRTKDVEYTGFSSTVQILNTHSGTERQYDTKFVPDSVPTPTASDGNMFTATNSFGTRDSSDQVDLVAVPAVFYDYYTDYEVNNGWRAVVTASENRDASTAKTDNKNQDASRTYENSFPFNALNQYISDQSGPDWNLPLYFGNFFTGHSLNYSGEERVICFGDNGWNNIASPEYNYTKVGLKYFSSQANNSMFMKSSENDYEKGSTAEQKINGQIIGYTDASKSYLGLVNDTMSDDRKLLVGNSQVAPYFDDAIVDAGLATKVNTDFPMRVDPQTDSGTGTHYNKYVFDSGNGLDNVYFKNYGQSDFNINYAYNAHSVYDALGGFGGDTNNKGFFPFDDAEISANNNLGYDYGFGMRLDIPFTVGENGYIDGTDVPMTFEFSGDDDVWVFVDNQLALDLGGDHKKAQGSINFATKQATITSGIYCPIPSAGSAKDGSTSFGNPDLQNYSNLKYTATPMTLDGGKTTNFYTASLAHIINYDNANWSNPAKVHTLTVFYMERGMSESNLKLEFTMSPVKNELEVDKSLDVTAVHDSLKAATTANAMSYDSFDYQVEVADNVVSGETNTAGTYYGNWPVSYPGKASNSPRIYKYLTPIVSGSTTISGGELDNNGKVEGIKIDNGFILDRLIAVGKWIRVTENAHSGNKYKYTAYMSVEDVTAEITGALSEGNQTSFRYLTSLNEGITKFAVHNVNKVDVGKLKISKVYTGSQAESFTFKIEAKVPGSDTFITLDDNYTVAKNGTGSEIDGIPIGSEIKITENFDETKFDNPSWLWTGEDNGITDSSISFELTDTNPDVTVTCTNTDKEIPKVTAKISAWKKINNQVPSNADSSLPKNFTFTLTPQNGAPTANVTYITNTGEISSNVVNLDANKTYSYVLTEDTNYTGNQYYKEDTSAFWIDIDTSTSPGTVTYFNAVKSGNTYSKGTAISTTVPTFYNRTYTLKFTKKLNGNVVTDVSALSDFEFTLVSTENSINYTQSNATSSSNGTYTFANLPAGTYTITETKAPSGYELSGTPITVTIGDTGGTESPTGIEFTAEMNNTPSTQLPQTGGIGVVIMIVGGLVLIGLGIYLLKSDKKKEDTK